MAINVSDMQAEFEKFYNEEPPYDWSPDEPPTTPLIMDKVGTLWQNVMEKGFLTVVPASTAVTTAAQTLGDWLRNNPPINDGGALFYAQVAIFFNTIMSAMPGFTLTTPPIPLVLSAPTTDKVLAASTLAGQVLNCGITGVVTNNITGVPQNLA